MSEHYDFRGTLPERSETATETAPSAPVGARPAPTKRRRPKTEKELYAEAAERAESLKQKLLARRGKNRDRFIEDLYRMFGVEAVDSDLDEADRLNELRSCLGQGLGRGPQEPR